MKKVISVAIFSGMVVTLHSLSPKQPTAPGWPLGPKADCQCEPLYELLLNFTQHLNTACAQRRCAPALVRSPSRARQSRTPGPRALAWPHESVRTQVSHACSALDFTNHNVPADCLLHRTSTRDSVHVNAKHRVLYMAKDLELCPNDSQVWVSEHEPAAGRRRLPRCASPGQHWRGLQSPFPPRRGGGPRFARRCNPRSRGPLSPAAGGSGRPCGGEEMLPSCAISEG